MVELVKSSVFDRWLDALTDIRAAVRIQVRLDRLALGNPGDVKPIGEGVSEMRIDYGPGYRVYFTRRGVLVVVLLCGGDKSMPSQRHCAGKATGESVQGLEGRTHDQHQSHLQPLRLGGLPQD